MRDREIGRGRKAVKGDEPSIIESTSTYFDSLLSLSRSLFQTDVLPKDLVAKDRRRREKEKSTHTDYAQRYGRLCLDLDTVEEAIRADPDSPESMSARISALRMRMLSLHTPSSAVAAGTASELVARLRTQYDMSGETEAEAGTETEKAPCRPCVLPVDVLMQLSSTERQLSALERQ
ncbi:hypothetical protein KIPB_009683, partial [Kipferlia bialata]|eukprot:g9683.t1